MRYLDEHPEDAEEIERQIREFFKQNSAYADSLDIGESSEEDDDDEISSSAESYANDSYDAIKDEDLISDIPEDL